MHVLREMIMHKVSRGDGMRRIRRQATGDRLGMLPGCEGGYDNGRLKYGRWEEKDAM